MEPILLLGRERFANLDLRIRVKGGGHVSQMYAVRQAISSRRPRLCGRFISKSKLSATRAAFAASACPNR